MFENKKIFILGMARSGYACAKLLAKYNNEIIINDFNEQDKNQIKELEDLGIKVIIGEHPDEIFTSEFDYLIKNPGISNEHKYVLFAKENKIKVINEVEVGYHFLPENVQIIGITGTNGKTTTSQLVFEIFKKANKKVILGGNIGYPLTSLIDDIKENSYLVIEISNFQLFNFINFKTNVSLLTNISEAHLDFHKDYNDYKSKKKQIFKYHTKDDYAIINFNDKESLKLTQDINSSKLYFSSSKKTDCYLEKEFIMYQNQPYLNVNEIKLQGNHNYENIMMSILVSKLYQIDDDIIKETIKQFSGVEHRLEFVTNKKGITVYNDSKSTNIKSTQIALKSFQKPTILLLGGTDRGQDFLSLKEYLGHVQVIIGYGEARNSIEKMALDLNKKHIIVTTLKEAVKEAYKNARKNDIILLSPASASWDQYKDFEERGKHFKKLIKEELNE